MGERKIVKTKEGREYVVAEEKEDGYIVYTGDCDEQGAPYMRFVYKSRVEGERG